MVDVGVGFLWEAHAIFFVNVMGAIQRINSWGAVQETINVYARCMGNTA